MGVPISTGQPVNLPKCPLCNGSGSVQVSGKKGVTVRKCPRCGGKGTSGPITK